ncbi:MAG: 4-(cytidine 5'-diphospho)-2-C-methyl-D-erythritol kinase [Verrucomicrobiaceae bacterium]|nr:MAG: 4-(cytidine 5'-diphospho)-2-C-methyl-D-erythritol kinase [Verrucomicrobiaceae bacterium]
MVKLPGLADTLEFREAEEFSFTCDKTDVPNNEGNLVVKAVRAYEAVTGEKCRVAIHLNKVVPHGAGLGGGSSDAAVTLLGINRLNGFKLHVEQLHEMAASFGSDIPFFLISGACRCTGRGEILNPIHSPPAIPVVLLKPSFSVPTPDSYKRWKQSIEISGISYSPQGMDGVELVNDLERPVFEKHRFLAEMKEWLLARQETRAALMSGSGSTVFAVLKNLDDAEAVAAAARAELDSGLWSWSGWTEGEAAGV